VTTNDATNAGVEFRLASLSPAQQASLGSSTARRQAVLDFLRGDRSNEGPGEGQLRVRGSPLGDIVDSRPVHVGPPGQPYVDTTDKGYSAFKAAHATRPARVYVGANDGMLHVFDAQSGDEAWAYVPAPMFRTDTAADRCGLASLAFPDRGAMPGTNCASDQAFRHRYYVNATPRVADVDLANNGTGWRTIVVGGLGKGGRGYFALDATDPASITSEAAAAAKVLWEFAPPELGYTYGRALIAKVRAGLKNSGDPQTWVVVVPSGYDSPDTAGTLYFLDPATGARLLELHTPGASEGLAHVAGYTRDPRNQLVEQIYGGDLAGNLWRFDVADVDPRNWSVTRLARLADASGAPQPVTTPPRIEVDAVTGADRWVLVGTGRLLHEDDLADTRTQTMYAIRDGTASAPAPITAPIGRADLAEVIDAGGLAAKPVKGWYDDLAAGERIVTELQAGASLVVYAATGPAGTDLCAPGQPAKIFAREIGRGRSQLRAVAGGPYVESVTIDHGAASLDIVALERAGSLPGAYFGDVRIAVTSRSGGQMQVLHIDVPTATTRHRMSWRVIPGD
jgi:type IV pilus assembly protein PilY1